MFDDIDPHEHEGVVLDLPAEQIPYQLQQERERVGTLTLWQYQAFAHHDHPAFSLPAEDLLWEQYQARERLAELLTQRFTHLTFVIETVPMDRSTWYQAVVGAPTEDEPWWDPCGPGSLIALHERLREPGADPLAVRKGLFAQYRDLQCERCQTWWQYETDYEREAFPGTRWSDCPHCGSPNVVAIRTLRDRISPQKPTSFR